MSSVNGAATARLARFSGVESENRYENLKKDREAARAKAIRDGLIPDPNRKTRLEEAFNLVGTCEDMCPEFEREQREYQRAVDKWELNPVTRRIDPKRAVKTFHRPAAGDETPLPSDVRPPHVLKMTLDYLIHDLLESNSLEATHHFLRDRTRSIRQDFTLQHENGLIAIECHERIARLHILSLHEMRGVQDFTEHMEMEQLRKVLQSIVEFYDDSRYSNTLPPNEPEFRAYHLLAHIRDPDVARQLERQPAHILDSPIVQVALDLRSLAQRNNITSSRRAANTEATQNFFSRLFATIRQPQVSFMMACLMEYHFADIRKGALKAMKSSFREAHKAFPIGTLTEMLGFDDETQTASFASACRLELVLDPASAMPVGVKLHSKALFDDLVAIETTKSTTVVTSKRQGYSDSDIVDGKLLIVNRECHTPVPPPTSPLSRKSSIVKHSNDTPTSLVPPQSSAFIPASRDSASTSQSLLSDGIQRRSSMVQRNIPPVFASGLSKPSILNTNFTRSPSSSPLSSPLKLTTDAFLSPGPQAQAMQSHVSAPAHPSRLTLSPVSTPPTRKRSSLFRSNSVLIGITDSPINPQSPIPLPTADKSPQLQGEIFVEERYEDSPIDAEIDTLSEMTLLMMTTAWAAMEVRNAIADQKLRMSTLQHALSCWIRRTAELVHSHNHTQRGRAALREMMRNANWELRDGDVSPTRARSSLPTPLIQQPVIDDQYAASLALSDARRTKLWSRGSFVTIIKNHLKLTSPVDARTCHIWLRTASGEVLDSTAQWLRRKLDIHGHGHDRRLKGLAVRSIGSTNPSAVGGRNSPSNPAIIIFEVSRSFGTVTASEMASNWRSELPRLLETINTILPGFQHMSALILVFWVPKGSDPTVFRSQARAAVADSMTQQAIVQKVRAWCLLALASAASADSQFEDCIGSLEFDAHVQQLPIPNIEDVIDPFFGAWNAALNSGMSKIVRDNEVSPKGFAILFDYAITALNELVQVSWKIRFGTPPEIALQVPSLHRKLERHNPDGLYSLLLEYFHLPALEAYPVVESFTAELKHHAHYPPPVLLSSVLRRLGDAVVLEVLLNAEMAEDTVTLLNRGDNPTEETEQALMKFKNDLDTRTRQIPRATESDWERATDVRSTDQSASEIGRKRALEEPGLTRQGSPDVKRSRPDLNRGGPVRSPVSPLALLKTVQEVRARHFPARASAKP